MENFRAIQAEFVRHNAIAQVPDAVTLETTLTDLLDHPEHRTELGKRARQVVEANQGALERTADVLAECLGATKPWPRCGRDTGWMLPSR
jgi:3-deoxy-D-manno-octulosonic-acid transferase